MLRFSRTSLHIGISRTGITLVRIRGWMRQQAEMVTDLESPASGKTHWEQLSEALATIEHAHLPVTITVSDDCARFFLVTPPMNATRLQDIRAATDMRFQTLYGDSTKGWRTWADWDFRKPFLACALPQDLIDAAHRLAKQYKLSIVSLVPHFVASWNRCHTQLKPDAWFAVAHAGKLTFASMEGQTLRSVRTIPMPDHTEERSLWMEDYIRREALRQQLTLPKTLQICGDIIRCSKQPSDTSMAFEHLAVERPGDSALLQHAGASLACAGAWR